MASIKMLKCQFQGCDRSGVRTIPVLIGPSEEPSEINVCEYHHRALVFDYTCSCEIVSVKEVKEDGNS